MFKDYYKILEIEQFATLEEIKAAFKKQAIRWHPDRNPNSDTTQKMQEINEAYLILKDQEARERYDIEYNKFKKFTTNESFKYKKEEEQNSSSQHQKTADNEYQFDDEVLKKWMENARKQAIDLAKQTIKEMAELSVTASKAAGSKMLETFIGYAIVGIIFLVLFKTCNN